MPNLGPTELIIILIIVIAIFGAGKIASLGGALGKGVRDFRKELKPDEEVEGSASAKSTEPKRAEKEVVDEPGNQA